MQVTGIAGTVALLMCCESDNGEKMQECGLDDGGVPTFVVAWEREIVFLPVGRKSSK